MSLCGLSAESEEIFDNVVVVNIRVAFRGETLIPYHWLYVPDPDVNFYRVGFPSNVVEKTCPAGTSSISLEYSMIFDEKTILNTEDMASEAILYLQDMGFIRAESIVFSNAFTISPAYVINRSPGRQAFEDIFARLAEYRIYCVGRYGRWDYLSMEDAFMNGMQTVRTFL